ncbi:DUF1761 domain-containing protein [Celeribacter litoreus]|uniref:DUF1761 domain-containing protein n=1 Tax=Celeribacter litoreus TaxID=2876714 RepID=UPI001CCB190A|nr:DUF1761 domain-containing protein [Celeribacter litoreus]MCA0042724.1 DUF1761 domain-containing protein [Celeribacter litoreus]
MGLLNVFAAGIVAWLAGLGWYHRFGTGRATRPRLVAAVALPVMILVAGFLRHIYMVSGLTSGIPLGLIAGMGVGLFFISPWLWLRDLAQGQANRSTLIDAGYACVATAIMGALLVAF